MHIDYDRVHSSYTRIWKCKTYVLLYFDLDRDQFRESIQLSSIGTVAYKNATVGREWTRVLCLNTRLTKQDLNRHSSKLFAWNLAQCRRNLRIFGGNAVLKWLSHHHNVTVNFSLVRYDCWRILRYPRLNHINAAVIDTDLCRTLLNNTLVQSGGNNDNGLVAFSRFTHTTDAVSTLYRPPDVLRQLVKILPKDQLSFIYMTMITNRAN